jgi:hypothetical protein
MAGSSQEDSASPVPEPSDENLRQALDHVVHSLRGLRFGHVTITVQDGVVIQVERVERKRLNISSRKSNHG